VKSKLVNTAQLATQNSTGSRQIIVRRTLCVLLILQCLAVVTRADISKQELQNWVDESALIFTGKLLSLGSNVDSIDIAWDLMLATYTIKELVR
jgi:hypothetical protein